MNGQPRRKQCFVIGPYGTLKSEERKWSTWVLQNIVKPVVEKDTFGYEANRTIDDPAPGQITKRIMRDLRAADLVVADLTGANPNVYYELALRHAAAKPYIHLVREGTKIPFDIEVMNVIEVCKAKEAEAKEQLRSQVENVQLGRVDFLTDACEPQVGFQTRGYDWEINYSSKLANEWKLKKDQAVKKAIDQFNSRGGSPQSEDLRQSLLEYLAYKASQGMRNAIKLYYTADTQKSHFEGSGVAPAIGGREAVILQVSGYENTGSISLTFEQPVAHVKIRDLEGDVGPYLYIVEFRASRRRPGEFDGKFHHPDYPDLRVGECLLRPIS